MKDVRDIAKWFLCHEAMTHKKLQKLCYYAQAWYCALYDGTPLYEDEIQAWIHGPVVASLYPVYADYKWLDIPQAKFDDSDFDDQTIAILEAVYDTYGGFTGDQLEALTHSEMPWIEARGELAPWETSGTVISTASLRTYYGKVYEQAQRD